jgi:hypothetical protein
MAMSLDEIKRQFVEQVKLRAYDDKYIDKTEEREILQLALQHGVTVDSARAALAQVCEANGYILESRILTDIKQTIELNHTGVIAGRRCLCGVVGPTSWSCRSGRE